MALLLLKDISFHAGEKMVLNGLILAIEKQEVHALLGTNGTGKTTLACLIMGCGGYRPLSGDIVFDGRSINSLGIHERAALGITMAWQEPARFEGISVRRYLTLKNKDDDPAPYLEMVGLHPATYLDRMMDKSLSGGERKRVELASVLALNPKLAVLDEPDSGIDMLSTGDIINVVNAFKKRGASVLLITHREEIASIADKASQLCGGRVVCSGEPEMVAEYFKSRKCLKCDGEVCANVRA
jgi:Fe-S cluster assembly ATP-binding protein